jgi:ACR3 family arsenite efflux pump ArsB
LPVWIGLFGFTEVRATAGIAGGVVEVAAFVVLAAGAPSLGRLDWEQRDE